MKKEKNFIKYDADICIVGYGLVSTYLINLLLPLKKKIIIIEKGSKSSSVKNKNRNINYGLEHKASQNYLGLKTGGNSSRWGGQLAEMTTEDLKKNYWGMNFRELKALYSEVYKNLGIQKLFEEKKIENNFHEYRTIFLKNPNLYNQYEKNQKKIKILTNTSALNFFFDKTSLKKISCINNNYKKFFISSKVFIICNGAIESTRLMLTNQKDVKKTPFKNNKNIGKYFSDHIGFYVAKLNIYNEKFFRYNFENLYYENTTYQKKYRFYDNETKLNVSIEFKFLSKYQNEIDNAKNILKKIKNTKKIYTLFPIFLNFRLFIITVELIIYYIKYRRIKIFFDKGIILYFQSEHLKSKKNRIFLSNKKLNDGLYQTIINWNIGEKERNLFLKLCKKLNLFFVKKNMGSLIVSKNLKNKKNFLKNIQDTNHASGGLQISKNHKNGVCNNNLRVHNTDNLFLLSSSIFPSNGSANITLTIFAYAHKLKKILYKFLQKK